MDRITKLGLVASLTVLLFCRGGFAQDASSCFDILARCEVVIGSLQEIPENICSRQSNTTMCRVGIRDTCDTISIPTLLSEAAKFYDYRCSEAGLQDFRKFNNCTSTSSCQAMREPPTAPNYCTASKSFVSCVATNCESGAESYAKAEEELGYVLSYRLCGYTGISCRDKHSLCESSQTTGDLAGLCSVGRTCLEDAYQTCQDRIYGLLIAERIGVIAYKCSAQGMADKTSFTNCQSLESCRSEAREKGLEICREGDEIITCLQRNCSEGAARYFRETSDFTGCTGIGMTTLPTLPSTAAGNTRPDMSSTVAPATLPPTLPPPIELNRCQQTAKECSKAIDNRREEIPFCSDYNIIRCREDIRENCRSGTVPPVWYEVAKFYDYRCSLSGQSALRDLREICSRDFGCDLKSIIDCQSGRRYLSCVARSCTPRVSRYARVEVEILEILSVTFCGSDAMSCVDKYVLCKNIMRSTHQSSSTFEAFSNEICSRQSDYSRCLYDVRETCSNNAVARRFISEPIRVLKYKCSQQGKQDAAIYSMCAAHCQPDQTLHHCQSHEQERACVESACGEAAARYFNETTEEPTGICVAKEPLPRITTTRSTSEGTAGTTRSVSFGIGIPILILILVIIGLLYMKRMKRK